MSFVPGMTGAVSMTTSVPPLLADLEKISHAVSHQSGSVAWPLGHRAGDLVLMYDWKYVESNGNNPPNQPPDGFTVLINQTGVSGEIDPPDQGMTRVILSYRILDGTEPDIGFISGMSTGNRQTGKYALLFRGDLPISAVTLKNQQVVIGTSGYDTRTITASTGTKPLIVFSFGAVNSSTQVGFGVQNPAFQEVINNANDMICGYFCYPRNSTPVNHQVDAFTNVGGSNNFGANRICAYLEVA